MGDRALGAYSLAVTCDDTILEIVPPISGGTTAEFSGQPTQSIHGCAANLAAFQGNRLDGPAGTVNMARALLRVKERVEPGTTATVTVDVNSIFDTGGVSLGGHPASLVVTVGSCPSDCDRNGSVTVDELIRGVNTAFGLGDANDCAASDADGNGSVTVDDVIRGVTAALDGC